MAIFAENHTDYGKRSLYISNNKKNMFITPTLKHPFLQVRVKELVNLQNAIDQHLGNISLQKFNFKPNPKSWSVAECMQHLLLVYAKYRPTLVSAFAKADIPKSEREVDYRPSWVGKQFMKFVNPDKIRKFPAPPILQPTKGTSYELSLIQDFKAYLAEVQSFIMRTDAENIDFQKIKIRTSISSWLRFNLGDYFHVETMHSRRHFAQMLRTIKVSE